MRGDISLRDARPSDAARCHEIELAAFAGPEAAPLERIAARIAGFPEGFRVLEQDGAVQGFINSGCAWTVDLADDDFKALKGHDPAAPKAVILSVAIDPARQGRGLARVLMADFVARMTALGKRELHLICKTEHIPLYERLGFLHVGPSASSHGGRSWHEMMCRL